MNQNFPERTRPYLAVFVVDLSQDLRTFNNLLMDCDVQDEDDQAALIEYAVRRVIYGWGVFVRKPQPSAIYITEKTLGRVIRYVDHSTKFKLTTLKQILQWAPSNTVDDILVDSGSLYFCYEDQRC